jgi:hypothetical protein
MRSEVSKVRIIYSQQRAVGCCWLLDCWRSDATVVCYMTDYLLTEISIRVISRILRFAFTIPITLRYTSEFPSVRFPNIGTLLTGIALPLIRQPFAQFDKSPAAIHVV